VIWVFVLSGIGALLLFNSILMGTLSGAKTAHLEEE